MLGWRQSTLVQDMMLTSGIIFLSQRALTMQHSSLKTVFAVMQMLQKIVQAHIKQVHH